MNAMNVTDRVDLIYKEGVIEIGAPSTEDDLEDRPEFALFLGLLSTSALLHPERLRAASDVMAGDEDLFAGVEAIDA